MRRAIYDQVTGEILRIVEGSPELVMAQVNPGEALSVDDPKDINQSKVDLQSKRTVPLSQIEQQIKQEKETALNASVLVAHERNEAMIRARIQSAIAFGDIQRAILIATGREEPQ